MVDNLAKTKQWYKDNLNFEEVSTTGNEVLLRLVDFELRLNHSPTALRRDSVQLPVRYLQGYFKLGFATNDIEQLYSDLQGVDVRLMGEIFDDANLDRKSFIAFDPDGNRIQFFSSVLPDAEALVPFFVAVITSDLEKTVQLYSELLESPEIIENDLASRDIYIRLLHKPEMLIELIHTPSNSISAEVVPGHENLEVHGISQITFGVNRASRESLTAGGLLVETSNSGQFEDPNGNKFSTH